MKYSDDNYDKEINRLFLRFPSVQKVPFSEAYKPGLERMEQFDAILGRPDKMLRTVHVAGTNGKGSISNMLASVLSACGLKVGLYTSPHILDFRERMRVALAGATDCNVTSLIPKDYVYDFIMAHKADFEKLDLSFFEISTGMAFSWFADEGCDAAVIEVGLGGRLDSTNIITPELSVIGQVGLDHCQILGDTLEAIAWEKAGIIKPGVPAVIGELLPQTEPVFERKAFETGSPLVYAERMEWDLDGVLEEMDLRGEYQKKNLRTVMAAVSVLSGDGGILHGMAGEDSVRRALIHTASRMDFHGRWERISRNPDVIMDIGHNAPALAYNFRQLEESMQHGYDSLIIVYAIMADKDLDAIMPLMPHDATYVFATPSTSRAMPSTVILGRYAEWRKSHGMDTDRLFCSETVGGAVSEALELASFSGGNPLIYIGGSTFAVADAVPLFPKHG